MELDKDLFDANIHKTAVLWDPEFCTYLQITNENKQFVIPI